MVFSLNVFIKSAKRWTALIVARILHNKAYIGTFISNKSVTIAPKIKKINSAENRIIIENHHPAIIDKDVFENVTKRFNKSGHSKKDNSFYSELKGKVK
ncbi:MAG: recombinase family protein, partial [Firmicutes bacterium]|nr:recombinase family protein [Bacillota bacterium]